MSNTVYISAQTAYMKAFAESIAPKRSDNGFAAALENCINEQSLDDYKEIPESTERSFRDFIFSVDLSYKLSGS